MHPQWNTSSTAHPQVTLNHICKRLVELGELEFLLEQHCILNNSDIAANQEHTTEPMKAYCKLQESCQRNLILKYLGSSCVTQKRCCCICDGTYNNVAGNLQRLGKPRVRALPSERKTLLKACILKSI